MFKNLTKKQRKYYGFTLVELIIVITILAILSTISFVGFSGYIKNARDSKRISTLSSIEKGLEQYNIFANRYPEPEDVYLTGNLGGEEITRQGYIKENVSNILKFNNVPQDPLSNDYYVYGVNYNNTKFQISTVLEELQASIIIPKAYAQGQYISKVLGNYDGIINKNGNIYFIESLIITEESDGIIDNIQDLGEETNFVTNESKNLPYSHKQGVEKNGGGKKLGHSISKEVLKENFDTLKETLSQEYNFSPTSLGIEVFGEVEYQKTLQEVLGDCIFGDGETTGSLIGGCSL